ncbi:carboxyl transferase domain-containing protein [Nocardia stercoris]|uniref:Acetyl-coenzyme A carboxylase carboxyl transferase subunits beta/alpha n=1 Tax=Nocardia stercoris TaxID=2483361 RepID=A0A3M2KYG2_9NOCA|nr:carboxyl transferase domain-containing protein [Nocardia stercoris]RMI29676.1 acetyl-CoA carboxyl transferase [Nocardia stercoris]
MTLSAADLLGELVDRGSFVSWDGPVVPVPVSAAYRAELTAAAERSGTDESVVTGEALLRGRRVAVIACEFRFLAGSIGVAAAERVVRAVERATELGLPLLASPTSGGTRMQEGTVAFVQMVKIAGAVAAHKQAGYPYLVYLRDPTMGGVFASWGSLGHMTFAEPGARIGFLGPRVYEALYGHPFPEGVQTAENLYRSGVVDGVLPAGVFRRVAHRVLEVVDGARGAAGAANAGAAGIRVGVEGRGAVPEPDAPRSPRGGGADRSGHGAPDSAVRQSFSAGGDPVDAASATGSAPSAGESDSGTPAQAWRDVRISREPGRPGIRELLRRATNRVPLSGTGQGESDRTVLHAFAQLGGRSCIVFGHDRSTASAENTMGPAALREAQRAMRLAAELHLPLVLVIDTAGAALSREAEERGLAPEIARCLAELVTLDTPTVSVLLGQGSGGGALALLPADRVLAAQHSWLAPLPPEGASELVYRDPARAPEVAAAQRIRARDLLADGIVDRIVAENPDAATEPEDFARRMVDAIAAELTDLGGRPTAELRALRSRRYRRLGLPTR